MIMRSLLTWMVGAGVLVVASLLLRFLANEAHEVTRARGRALFAREPKGSNAYDKAA